MPLTLNHGTRRRLLALTCLAALVSALLAAQASPASAAPSGVLFGAVVHARSGQETFAQAVARQDKAYGRMPISRVFFTGAPDAWPGNAGASGRPVVVSFRFAPADILAGTYDAQLRSWFSHAPPRDVYWSYLHEPEDNIARGEFTSAEYTKAWYHVSRLSAPYAAANPDLHSTLILMCYTMNPASHRNWRNYYVGSGTQSMVAFDCYNHAGHHGAYGDPATIFKPLTDWASANPTIPWGVSEVGSVLSPQDADGSQRAAWLRSVGSFLAKRHEASANAALFGIYYDVKGPKGTDYRLTDSKSRLAWRDVVQNY